MVNYTVNRIFELMEEKGVSSYALAKIIGISGAAISKWKNGKTTPSYENLVALADYFNVPVDSLYEENPFRELRIKNGYSQQEVAKLLHVNQTAVSQWERGVTTPPISILLALCDLYNTTPDLLLGKPLENAEEMLAVDENEKIRSEVVKPAHMDGSRVKSSRKAAGLTQQELAERLAVSQRTVAAWEAETRAPSIELLINLANILGVSIEYLLGTSDVKNANVETVKGGVLSFAGHGEETIEITKEEAAAVKEFLKLIRQKQDKNK